MNQKDIRLIHQFVDYGLSELKKLELMQTPGNVPIEMKDGTKNEDGWITWKPIKSTVTNSEIIQLEVMTNCNFPISFIEFLKYKHFYGLYLAAFPMIRFYNHPIKNWLKKYVQMYSYDWVREDLISNKIIPFADYGDYGFLCFDAREKYPNNEYPILMVDHELVGDIDSYEMFNSSFMEMVKERLIEKK